MRLIALVDERSWLQLTKPSQTQRVRLVVGSDRLYESRQSEIIIGFGVCVSVAGGRRLDCKQAHAHYEAAGLVGIEEDTHRRFK